MELLNFICSNALPFIIVLVIILLILVLFIVLIRLLVKNKKVISLSLFGKKNNKTNDENDNKIDNISHSLYSHKFFSSVKYNFVEKDYDFK